jgi:hypothetical protein
MNSSSFSFSAYEVTAFFVRVEALPLEAGVAVFEVCPFGLAAAFLGVLVAAGAAFLTGSDRLGLFELAKKSEVVVSSSSGLGSFFAFFAAGFFGVDLCGLYLVSDQDNV